MTEHIHKHVFVSYYEISINLLIINSTEDEGRLWEKVKQMLKLKQHSNQ